MSDTHDIISDICYDRAVSTTDPVTLATGQIIQAEIEGPIDPFTVQSDLGQDLREVCKLHVLDDAQAALVKMNTMVSFTLFGARANFKIVKRVDNPADIFTVFWAVKQTKADQ